jgi:hypothetical protein
MEEPMQIIVVKEPISLSLLKQMALEGHGDMVKAVADIRLGLMAVGGEMHADAESLLLQQGSNQKDLWGFNLLPGSEQDIDIEYTSFINIRPKQNNRSLSIEDADVRLAVDALVSRFIDRRL